MYAIIKIGGKQHIVRQNEVIKVDRLAVEAGDDFEVKKVLAVGENEELNFGTPYVEGASVKFKVLENKKDKKVVIFKKKRRKRYQVKNGHRQHLSVLKVVEVKA